VSARAVNAVKFILFQTASPAAAQRWFCTMTLPMDGAVGTTEDAFSRSVDLALVRHGWLTNASCRALDVVVSSLLLVLLTPLLLIVALTIRLDSPGPVFFRQRRIGRDLEPFTVHKFRTMRHGANDDVHRSFVLGLIAGVAPEKEDGPRFKMSDDARVTRIGRLLRRTSIDEIPQLWNVVRGEMSLVGPRPPIPYEVEHYPPHWFGRFAVKPGVTGLWQVSGRSQVTLEEMVALDIQYAQRRTLWTNLWILLRTIPAVISLRGAS
jgi:lipopolysaccharide/colanic/teichoic acid biosynthesis glycosyltransferase